MVRKRQKTTHADLQLEKQISDIMHKPRDMFVKSLMQKNKASIMVLITNYREIFNAKLNLQEQQIASNN